MTLFQPTREMNDTNPGLLCMSNHPHLPLQAAIVFPLKHIWQKPISITA